MAEVVMPRLCDTMEEGTLSRWLKQRGRPGPQGRHARRDRDRQGHDGAGGVRRGRPATPILVPEGATVPIGEPIARRSARAAARRRRAEAAAPGRASAALTPPPTPQAPPADGRQAAPDAEAPQAAAPTGPAVAARQPAEPPQAPPAARSARPGAHLPARPQIAREHGIDIATSPGPARTAASCAPTSRPPIARRAAGEGRARPRRCARPRPARAERPAARPPHGRCARDRGRRACRRTPRRSR